jgi:FAD/FMN-containing dehydrogenase
VAASSSFVAVFQLRGVAQHARAVERLRASYADIPSGMPVRLAKRTSNLFRPRAASQGPGLDVSGLDGVISIDRDNLTADVQGMCTYEHLVDATLPHGLMPYVVPQLRSITLGGAVTGLGIESTSFRSGLPHESVVEMDVLTGAGEIVTATPDNEHAQLFLTFPNSFGSLGYATRLRIKLERVRSHVALRHLRFDDPGLLAKTIAEIVENGEHEGTRVDGIDGTSFEPGEHYLTLARWTDAEPGLDHEVSDYTGERIYYRSLQTRETDLLTTYDYLWRWDTDWFWCSGAFGLSKPWVRRLWPRRYRRSDVYHKLIAIDRRYDIADRIDRRLGNPVRERVIQDVEIPVERLPEFLEWFDREIGMRPVWLCPVVAFRDWPTYPLEPHRTYVNVGFWGGVRVGEEASEAPLNRAVETKVHELGGHKSLYSEAFYDRETFDGLYDGDNLAAVKHRYDPDDRFTSLYDKVVSKR